MTQLAPIPEILDELRAGRMIILVDDEQRENEGDLICAAEFITPKIINFMVRNTPGYLCIALTGEECDRLDLHPQASMNTSLRGTPMAVSIDGHPRHGVDTGISASDRARTVRIVADPASRPDDLVRPGHMVPLRARDGGVLARTGQTEGSVDLMKLARLRPAAVISEVCKDDGEMARMPELEALCAQHNLKMCSVEQVIAYRLERETLVSRLEPTAGLSIETAEGTFNLITYHSTIDPLPHLALTTGGVGALDSSGHPIESSEPTLVRVHSRDVLGDIFGVSRSAGEPPSGEQLRAAMRAIQRSGRGAVVYLRPSALCGEAGSALSDQLHSLRLEADSDANRPDLLSATGIGAKTIPAERRDFGIGGQILRDLGLSRIRVLTNHPHPMHGLSSFGIEIVEHIPLTCT
ncbi:MAG: 3,4-dihydroxy-2-butanone-4-phosphate synthase [Phycisphaerales bacterium]|nr:3,4-dihydroxy-2-butanone-4-phosphate synthase [Phycisphaerales bacterium]